MTPHIAPFGLEMILHYNCTLSKWNNDSEVTKEYHRLFLSEGLIVKAAVEGRMHSYDEYEITARGRAYVLALCCVPFPIPCWRLPNSMEVLGEERDGLFP